MWTYACIFLLIPGWIFRYACLYRFAWAHAGSSCGAGGRRAGRVEGVRAGERNCLSHLRASSAHYRLLLMLFFGFGTGVKHARLPSPPLPASYYWRHYHSSARGSRRTWTRAAVGACVLRIALHFTFTLPRRETRCLNRILVRCRRLRPDAFPVTRPSTGSYSCGSLGSARGS